MSNHQWNEIEPKMLGMWQDALSTMTDINNKCFSGKHQACPYCSGKDRFRFDNNRYDKGDGGALCSQCGSGNGIYWLQKLTGWSFSDAVNACGDFIGAVPPERIAIAKKNVQLIPDNIYSATAAESDISRIMARAIDFPTHIYPLEQGIAPEPLMVLNKEQVNGKGEREVIDSRIVVQMIKIDEFPAEGKEPKGTPVNLVMIDKTGGLSFPVGKDEYHPNGKMAFGAVSVIGANTKKAIYLCADWADSWHVHHATGAQVWCCYTVSNLDKVAYYFYPECTDGRLRMACNYSFDELCEAEKRSCKVILPVGNESIKEGRQFQKVIFDPGALLDEMTSNMADKNKAP